MRRANGNPAIHNNTLPNHFENEGKFVRFLADYAQAVGVSVTDDRMVEAQCNQEGIEALSFASGGWNAQICILTAPALHRRY
jgi:hypothetical protein